MVSFPLPVFKKTEDFKFPYLGLRQFSDNPFCSVAYAQKVYRKLDLLLPQRMMETSEV